MRALLMAVALFASPEVDTKPAPPKLQVRVYPRAGFTPAYVRVSALALDPGKQLHCPDWRYEFGDGSASSGSQWCDPYLVADEQPDRYAFPQRTHIYRLAGEYEVVVTVSGGEEPLTHRATVIVTGRQPLEP
jgi:hypothetical protein